MVVSVYATTILLDKLVCYYSPSLVILRHSLGETWLARLAPMVCSLGVSVLTSRWLTENNWVTASPWVSAMEPETADSFSKFHISTLLI